MLLTAYYLAFTSVQSWKLHQLHQKISRVVDAKNSVVFVKKSDENRQSMVTALASSEICVNSAEATVQDCFWSNDISQGISISPKQILYINPFITFPSPPSLIPFSYSFKNLPESSKNDIIHALIEADLVPDFINSNLPILEIEAFTQMVAWKIDTKLSILVKTSAKQLSQLIFASFVQNQYIINDHLQLSRIQTVNVEGTPQDYEQILGHSKKDVLLRSKEFMSPVDWDNHLEGIRNLGVLANQACEFEYKKNLTEGKTGIVQPDLISSKNIEESLTRKDILSPDTPKKKMVRIEKTEEKIQELKQELRKQNDCSAFQRMDSKHHEDVTTPESPKFPVTPSKSAKNKTKITNEVTSPKFPIGSPAKKTFFVSKTDENEPGIGDSKDSLLDSKRSSIDSRSTINSSKTSLNDPKYFIANNVNKNHVTAAAVDTHCKSPGHDVQDSKVNKNVQLEENAMKKMTENIVDLSRSSGFIQDAKNESAKIIESEKVQFKGPIDKVSVSNTFPVSQEKLSFSSGQVASEKINKDEKVSIEQDVKEAEKEVTVKEQSDKSKQPNLKEIGKVSNVVELNTKEPIESAAKHSTNSFIANEQKANQDFSTNVKKPKEEVNKFSEKILEPPKSEPSNAFKSAPEAPSSAQSKPIIQRSRKKLMEAKPPNVLVYSDSTTTRTNVIKTLGGILKENMYTIYPLSVQKVRERIWVDNTTLLVVCGSVNGSDVSQIFLEYFFKGGKVLCLCSDLLRQVLPTYHTAEVREHELVQFSYGQWKNIKMMHHIFCYQPSPIRKHFSQDSDEPPKEKTNSNPLIVLPRSIELKDDLGMNHNVQVQILGTEDTWKTPSLLMVSTDNGGKIIFSQIHLEIDPSFYENDEQKYQILMKNDNLRHEIFGDVLSTHLGLSTADLKEQRNKEIQWTRGYFLGRHELKFEILEKLKPFMDENNTLKTDGFSVKFCGKNVEPPSPMSYCFPVMIHSCPDDFSTVEYFDTLKTVDLGRAVIYSHVLSSTLGMMSKMRDCNGLAIVSRILTQATGRSSNSWLTPEGSLMFTLQVHIPLNSTIGQRIPLLQHLVATAIVTGIRNVPGYEGLDINLKWPNDIYANGERKLGGLLVNSTINGDQAICNIGLGFNLGNSTPTTCVNDMILEYNKKHSKNLKPLTLEKTLAIIFNEIENILNRVQADDIDYLYNLYYSCWLHTDSSVKVISPGSEEKNGTIVGIDEYGFLKIRLDNNQIESVQPDGNSFDMLRGLIIPKAH